jgi:hypothetical protein
MTKPKRRDDRRLTEINDAIGHLIAAGNALASEHDARRRIAELAFDLIRELHDGIDALDPDAHHEWSNTVDRLCIEIEARVEERI